MSGPSRSYSEDLTPEDIDWDQFSKTWQCSNRKFSLDGPNPNFQGPETLDTITPDIDAFKKKPQYDDNNYDNDDVVPFTLNQTDDSITQHDLLSTPCYSIAETVQSPSTPIPSPEDDENQPYFERPQVIQTTVITKEGLRRSTRIAAASPIRKSTPPVSRKNITPRRKSPAKKQQLPITPEFRDPDPISTPVAQSILSRSSFGESSSRPSLHDIDNDDDNDIYSSNTTNISTTDINNTDSTNNDTTQSPGPKHSFITRRSPVRRKSARFSIVQPIAAPQRIPITASSNDNPINTSYRVSINGVPIPRLSFGSATNTTTSKRFILPITTTTTSATADADAASPYDNTAQPASPLKQSPLRKSPLRKSPRRRSMKPQRNGVVTFDLEPTTTLIGGNINDNDHNTTTDELSHSTPSQNTTSQNTTTTAVIPTVNKSKRFVFRRARLSLRPLNTTAISDTPSFINSVSSSSLSLDGPITITTSNTDTTTNIDTVHHVTDDHTSSDDVNVTPSDATTITTRATTTTTTTTDSVSTTEVDSHSEVQDETPSSSSSNSTNTIAIVPISQRIRPVNHALEFNQQLAEIDNEQEEEYHNKQQYINSKNILQLDNNTIVRIPQQTSMKIKNAQSKVASRPMQHVQSTGLSRPRALTAPVQQQQQQRTTNSSSSGSSLLNRRRSRNATLTHTNSSQQQKQRTTTSINKSPPRRRSGGDPGARLFLLAASKTASKSTISPQRKRIPIVPPVVVPRQRVPISINTVPLVPRDRATTARSINTTNRQSSSSLSSSHLTTVQPTVRTRPISSTLPASQQTKPVLPSSSSSSHPQPRSHAVSVPSSSSTRSTTGGSAAPRIRLCDRVPGVSALSQQSTTKATSRQSAPVQRPQQPKPLTQSRLNTSTTTTTTTTTNAPAVLRTRIPLSQRQDMLTNSNQNTTRPSNNLNVSSSRLNTSSSRPVTPSSSISRPTTPSSRLNTTSSRLNTSSARLNTSSARLNTTSSHHHNNNNNHLNTSTARIQASSSSGIVSKTAPSQQQRQSSQLEPLTSLARRPINKPQPSRFDIRSIETPLAM